MALEMKGKFNKYWEHYSLILAIAAVLDLRFKVEMLEVAYKKVDAISAEVKITKLKKNLEMIFSYYQTGSSSFSATPYDLLTESPLEDDFDNDLFELERCIESGVNKTKTQLDIYLAEPRLEWKSFPNLDVSSYWKSNQGRLGDLASMARDVLSIPITTIASESAFSIGARVLTPYRNRLLPENVQALLCTRNWLRGFSDYEGTTEDNDHIGYEGAGTANNSGVHDSRSEGSSVP